MNYIEDGWMKKVGIMSMQRIANYGSFLQAYALKQLIEKLGCKGTIIIECGKMLSDAGYKIKVLNTINFKKSMDEEFDCYEVDVSEDSTA